MRTTQKFPTPPWDMDTAAERLTFETTAWNSHNIGNILAGYAENIEMRDGLSFINGKQELAAFIDDKLRNQQNYHLKLDLWGALKGRMAIRFEAEWQDAVGGWYKSFGVQVFQFNDEGLIEKRFASEVVTEITGVERKLI